MSPVSGTRLAVTILRFELGKLRWRDVLLPLALPLVFAALGGSAVLTGRALDGKGGERVLVATADPGIVRDLSAALDDWEFDAVPALPDDLDAALAAGDHRMALALDPDPAAIDPVRIHAAPDDAGRAWALERAVTSWLSTRWVAAVAGPAPPLTQVGPGAGPDRSDADAPSAGDLVDDPAALSSAGFLAVVFAALIGMSAGAQAARSGREGFASVAGLLAPRWALYAGSMASAALVLSMWYAGFAAILGGGGALALVQEGRTPPMFGLVTGGLGLGLLATLTVAQASAIGCAWEQLSQDIPKAVREQLPMILSIAVIAGVQVLLEPMFEEAWATQVAALPLVGPLGVWERHLDGSAFAAPAALQIAYAAAGIAIGAWFFAMTDSPVESARRRWRGRA